MTSATLPTVSAQPSALLQQKQILDLLCELTLNPTPSQACLQMVFSMSAASRSEFLRLADIHHVVVRALDPVAKAAALAGESEVVLWARQTVEAERLRAANVLSHLYEVCTDLEAAGCQTTVIKTLDHWPDAGSDIDLYTTAIETRVQCVMEMKFAAKVLPRSWGDRMAKKWNFAIAGLPEPIEIHVQRLGQMGEHTALARRFVTRRVARTIEGKTFFVPAPEERIIIATLQRMYRHFYFRVCDMVNSAALLQSGQLDILELKRTAEASGIWSGVATYMTIVSDFVKKFSGVDLELPEFVTRAAICGGDDIRIRANYLRLPIVPHGANLYSTQVTKAALNGDVPTTFRLGLLPYLASLAAVTCKVTGSDKGIW